MLLPYYVTMHQTRNVEPMLNNKKMQTSCKLAAFVHHVLQRQSAPEFVFASRARGLICTNKSIELN